MLTKIFSPFNISSIRLKLNFSNLYKVLLTSSFIVVLFLDSRILSIRKKTKSSDSKIYREKIFALVLPLL